MQNTTSFYFSAFLKNSQISVVCVDFPLHAASPCKLSPADSSFLLRFVSSHPPQIGHMSCLS